MYPRRSKYGYVTFLGEFITDKNLYVVCPSCSKKAIVTNAVNADDNISKYARIVCVYCGYSKMKQYKYYNIHRTGIDPYFQLPLWLMTECGGHILWAYNESHLDFLKNFIEAKHRERDIREMYNGSLASRLPQWMTSSKNKEAILKAINHLLSKI
ncbi:MAG: hypothetical protein JNK00_12835 [Flavipsychrobacter sp.]|nr:hypothetical protein [Flavipsychrobacter sp.]